MNWNISDFFAKIQIISLFHHARFTRYKTLIVRHAQRFKGKLSRVNANTELKLRKIKVKGHYILLHNFIKIVYIYIYEYEISVYTWNGGIYIYIYIYAATSPPSSGYLRWQIKQWVDYKHRTGFQSMFGIDVLPDITDVKYYLISFLQNWNEFLSLSPIMFCYQTNRFTSPPNSSCAANSTHIVLNFVWEVIIEYMAEI